MKTLVIIGNQVAIDGETKEVDITLPIEIDAVQWDNKMNKCFEELAGSFTMNEVQLSKYQAYIDKWNAIPIIEPELPFEETDPETIAKDKLQLAINAITVPYQVDGVMYTFSGHLIAQNRIAVALAKTKDKENKKLNWYTVDSVKVQLKGSDLDAILTLIDVQMELILDAV